MPPLKIESHPQQHRRRGCTVKAPPKDTPPSRPPPVNPNLLRAQARRSEGIFIDPDGDNRTPRPAPENTYEELEKFFPKHDLGKLAIEASSTDTSFTNIEQMVTLSPTPIQALSARDNQTFSGGSQYALFLCYSYLSFTDNCRYV